MPRPSSPSRKPGAAISTAPTCRDSISSVGSVRSARSSRTYWRSGIRRRRRRSISDRSRPPTCSRGSTADNRLELLPPELARPRIWLGNRSEVSAHFDLSDNIACVVAGRRRFTLFPPDQVANLYVGPLDHTMAGQPASMVAAQGSRLRALSALSRGPGRGAHRRARARRRHLHPDPVVAPCRGAFRLQRPRQLLVGGPARPMPAAPSRRWSTASWR